MPHGVMDAFSVQRGALRRMRLEVAVFADNACGMRRWLNCSPGGDDHLSHCTVVEATVARNMHGAHAGKLSGRGGDVDEALLEHAQLGT